MPGGSAGALASRCRQRTANEAVFHQEKATIYYAEDDSFA